MNKHIKLLVESFFDDMFTEKDEEQNDNSLLPEEDSTEQTKELAKLIGGINTLDDCETKDDYIEYIINICNIKNILKLIYNNNTNDGVNVYHLMDKIVFPDNDITYEKFITNKCNTFNWAMYDSFELYNKKYNYIMGNVIISGRISVLIKINLNRLGEIYLHCSIPVNNISEKEYIEKNINKLKQTLNNQTGAYKRLFDNFDYFCKLLHNECKTSLKIEEKHIETIKNLIEKRKNKYKFNWRADVISFNDLYNEINNSIDFIPYIVTYMIIYKQYIMKEYYRDNSINITYDDIMSIIILNILDINIMNNGSARRTIQQYKLDISLIINTYNKYYNDPRLLNATKEILG